MKSIFIFLPILVIDKCIFKEGFFKEMSVFFSLQLFNTLHFNNLSQQKLLYCIQCHYIPWAQCCRAIEMERVQEEWGRAADRWLHANATWSRSSAWSGAAVQPGGSLERLLALLAEKIALGGNVAYDGINPSAYLTLWHFITREKRASDVKEEK